MFTIGIVSVSALFFAIGTIFSRGGMTPWHTSVGGDFPQFYVVGAVLRNPGPSRLYDWGLQARRYHELIQADTTRATLPYAYPPAVALVMSPLSRLPYRTAAMAWAGISLLLYAGGLGLLWRTFDGIGRADRLIAVLLSLAFEPFIVECIHGGQLCAIGFAAICAALALHRGGKPLASGIALGLLAYKPTLILALVPALMLGRQWRMLIGVAVTIGVGAAIGLLLGFGPTFDFLKLMLTYVRVVTSGDGFVLFKYVDICAFLKLLWHDPAAVAWPAALMGLVVITVLAGRALRNGRNETAWIILLMGMLVCNLYVGIYDSVLAVAGMWVMADAAYRRDGRLSWDVRWLLIAVFLTPWITQLTARWLGMQIDTVILAVAAMQPVLRGIATSLVSQPQQLSPQLV